jgi:hypothetical protein
MTRLQRIPTLGQLRDISTIAKMIGRPYRQTYRLLTRLAARDAAEDPRGLRTWLIDSGRTRKKLINLQRLRAAHPAIFERRYVSREEHDDLQAGLVEVRAGLHELRQRVNGLGARMRKAIDTKLVQQEKEQG